MLLVRYFTAQYKRGDVRTPSKIRRGSGGGYVLCTLENLNAIDPGLEENKKKNAPTHTHTLHIHKHSYVHIIYVQRHCYRRETEKKTNTPKAYVVIIR